MTASRSCRRREKISVVILDLADPENPKTVANLPLKNSIVGPPVNLAIDPTNSIALVADSVDVAKDGDALKLAPDNKIYVIDLKANPPKLAEHCHGRQAAIGLELQSEPATSRSSPIAPTSRSASSP